MMIRTSGGYSSTFRPSPWKAVWAKFDASKTDGTTGPSRVPGGAKSLISHPERR